MMEMKENKKICVDCNIKVNEDDVFCSSCGKEFPLTGINEKKPISEGRVKRILNKILLAKYNNETYKAKLDFFYIIDKKSKWYIFPTSDRMAELRVRQERTGVVEISFHSYSLELKEELTSFLEESFKEYDVFVTSELVGSEVIDLEEKKYG